MHTKDREAADFFFRKRWCMSVHCTLTMKTSVVLLLALTLHVSNYVEASPIGPKMHALLRQSSGRPFYSHEDILGIYSRGRVSGADSLCPTTIKYTAVTPPNNVDQFSYQRKFSSSIPNTFSCSAPLTNSLSPSVSQLDLGRQCPVRKLALNSIHRRLLLSRERNPHPRRSAAANWRSVHFPSSSEQVS